jgi:CheY-specific phosphatase CheX
VLDESSLQEAVVANSAKSDIERRVSTLENYFKIGLGIAVILGLSGSWLGKVVLDAHQTAAEAKQLAQDAKKDLKSATDDAISTVKGMASTAVLSEVQNQVPAAVAQRFSELSSNIRLSYGSEQWIDYTKLDHSFDSRCPDGMVMTAWGYGSKNTDVRLLCRTITIAK